MASRDRPLNEMTPRRHAAWWRRCRRGGTRAGNGGGARHQGETMPCFFFFSLLSVLFHGGLLQVVHGLLQGSLSSPLISSLTRLRAFSMSPRSCGPTLPPCSCNSFSTCSVIASALLRRSTNSRRFLSSAAWASASLLHAVDFFLGEAGVALDFDLVFLAGGLVLGLHVQNAVDVDVEGDFDLRHAALGRRDAGRAGICPACGCPWRIRVRPGARGFRRWSGYRRRSRRLRSWRSGSWCCAGS